MRVLITGFGPYDTVIEKVDVNASWEGVQKLDKGKIESQYGIELVVQDLTVDYDKVHAKMTELWEENKDYGLVIHVGIAKVSGLRLEKQACKEAYINEDCNGCCPADFVHPLGEKDTIFNTAFDVDAILEEYNAEPPEKLCAEVSCNAGKFLCEYVYYTSLYHSDTKRVLFVHVPHEGYSHEHIAQGLERLLHITLNHCNR